MPWLSGWANRVELVIAAADIDADLTHFPLTIHLAAACGKGDAYDLSLIFDELGSSRFKIAVTDDSGDTEMYVEIEKWDDTAEEAVLHVSRSDWVISSSSSTTLYLYYDSTHADNTTYVGDAGSAGRNGPRENVWNSAYVCVLHLGEGSGTFYDSTSNDNDGTAVGSMTRAQDGLGPADNPCIHLDGSTGYVSVPDDTELDVTTFTVEALLNHDVGLSELEADEWYGGCGKGIDAEVNFRIGWEDWNDSWATGFHDTGYTWHYTDAVDNYATVSVWYHIAGTWSSPYLTTYANGVQIDQDDEGSVTPATNTDSIYVGALRHGYPTEHIDFWDGLIDEFRLSNVARPAAWIHATYDSLRDELLSYNFATEAFNDRSCTLDVELLASIFSDRDLAVNVEAPIFSDRALILNIFTPGIDDRSLVLNVGYQVLSDRDLALDVDFFLRSDRILVLDVETSLIFSNRSLVLDVELLKIWGITKDGQGNVLPSCDLWLFEASSQTFVKATTSDGVTGEYEFTVTSGLEYFIVGWKDGAPVLFGTTPKNMVGTVKP